MLCEFERTLYEIDNLNIWTINTVVWTINTVGVCVLIRIGEKDFLNCNCFNYENVPGKFLICITVTNVSQIFRSDRFSSFYVYWIQTYKHPNKQQPNVNYAMAPFVLMHTKNWLKMNIWRYKKDDLVLTDSIFENIYFNDIVD